MGGTSSWRPSVVTLCGDVGYVGWYGGGFGDEGNFGGDDNCSGDSRYKPRHYHERNCDVTKKERSSTHVMQRKSCREGSLVNQASDAHLLKLFVYKVNTLKTYLIQHPPRPFSRGQTVLYRGFQRQSETSERERRSS